MMKKSGGCSRAYLLKGALATPVAMASASLAAEPSASRASAGEKRPPLPTRKLGRNGPDVSMLAVGGQSEASGVGFYERAWDLGFRYFDMADCYRGGQSERDLGAWLRKYPERRGEIFIVDKDHPKRLSDLPGMLDKRLEVLGTDYLDLFLIHGIGPKEYGEQCYDWPKSREFKQISEKMKKSGKTKLVGFSCHDPQKGRFLHAAAEGGFVDAILTSGGPFYKPDDDHDRMVDAVHQAGIGLIQMKLIRNAKKIPKRVPEFDAMGLTTHQAALHAVWSDERVTAGCVWMNNDEEMTIAAEAARLYEKPLLSRHKQILRDLILAHGPALCPGCPSCSAHAAKHGDGLSDVSRFVAYYEQDGKTDAAQLYQALHPNERNVDGVDLEVMRIQCDYHVDYPEIVKRARRYFA